MNKQAIFVQNKILNHPSKLDQWLKAREKTLITLELYVTNQCTHNCPQCTGWNAPREGEELNIAEIKRYIRQAKQMDVRGVIFSGGGEPLLHSNIIQAITYATSQGLEAGLITNGTYLDNSYKQKQVLKNCKWIRFSLDAGSPAMYRLTHGASATDFQKTVRNIRQTASIKKSNPAYKATIGVGYLTGKKTADYKAMHDFARLTSKLGVDYIQYRFIHCDFTDASKNINRIRKQYGDIIVGAWASYKRFNESRTQRPYEQCHGIHFITTIGADAGVYPCCHLAGKPQYCLGNLRKEALNVIWKRRYKIFSQINSKDCIPLCRCDEMNRLLAEIKKDKEHVNFL